MFSRVVNECQVPDKCTNEECSNANDSMDATTAVTGGTAVSDDENSSKKQEMSSSSESSFSSSGSVKKSKDDDNLEDIADQVSTFTCS